MGQFKPKYDTFDIYVNGTRMRRIWGIKSAIRAAQQTAGDLFGGRLVEVIDIHTGEIKYTEGGGIMKK